MNYPLFSLLGVAGVLIGLSMANSEPGKDVISRLWRYCLSTDPMNRIALVLFLCVPLVNWVLY